MSAFMVHVAVKSRVTGWHHGNIHLYLRLVRDCSGGGDINTRCRVLLCCCCAVGWTTYMLLLMRLSTAPRARGVQVWLCTLDHIRLKLSQTHFYVHQNILHVWSWYIFLLIDVYHLHSADTGWISTDSTETGWTVMTRASQVSMLLCLEAALFLLSAGATPSFTLRTSGPASFPSLLTSSMKRLRISMFCADVDDLGAFENHFDNFDNAARCFLCFCLS